MVFRERHQVIALGEKERIGAYDQRAGSKFGDSCKRTLEFAFATAIHDVQLMPGRLCRHLHIVRLGRVTGVSVFTGILGAKKLGLLRELVPGADVIAFLGNPQNRPESGSPAAARIPAPPAPGPPAPSWRPPAPAAP
jgi:hypothetical protein